MTFTFQQLEQGSELHHSVDIQQTLGSVSLSDQLLSLNEKILNLKVTFPITFHPLQYKLNILFMQAIISKFYLRPSHYILMILKPLFFKIKDLKLSARTQTPTTSHIKHCNQKT